MYRELLLARRSFADFGLGPQSARFFHLAHKPTSLCYKGNNCPCLRMDWRAHGENRALSFSPAREELRDSGTLERRLSAFRPCLVVKQHVREGRLEKITQSTIPGLKDLIPAWQQHTHFEDSPWSLFRLHPEITHPMGD
jgi:hypothetical protein